LGRPDDDADDHEGVGKRLRRYRNIAQRQDCDRSHTDEVQRRDRQHHSESAAIFAKSRHGPRYSISRDGAEAGGQRNRHDDEIRIPSEGARHLEGGHPGVVHRGDAQAENGSADLDRRSQTSTGRNEESCPSENNGDPERCEGKARLECSRGRYVVAQHCREMRRPHRPTCCQAGEKQEIELPSAGMTPSPS
jgi:hypothetical protein